MIHESLIDGLETQIAAIRHQIAVEQEKLHREADQEKSLHLRERVRLLEIFLGVVQDSRTKLFLADGARDEGEARFLKWRLVFFSVIEAREVLDGLAKKLERARLEADKAQHPVDVATAACSNFERSKPVDNYMTEPEKEKRRIELGKLQAIVSEKLAERNALILERDTLERRWFGARDEVGRLEFQERHLHPPSPPEPKHSIGELLPVK